MGHAWLKVAAMKGMLGFGPASGVLGRSGIERGRLGFEVADFGNGGSESSSGVSPGINKATTFWMSWVFCKCIRCFGVRYLG